MACKTQYQGQFQVKHSSGVKRSYFGLVDSFASWLGGANVPIHPLPATIHLGNWMRTMPSLPQFQVVPFPFCSSTLVGSNWKGRLVFWVSTIKIFGPGVLANPPAFAFTFPKPRFFLARCSTRRRVRNHHHQGQGHKGKDQPTTGGAIKANRMAKKSQKARYAFPERAHVY
jgi:hypothetical protein